MSQHPPISAIPPMDLAEERRRFAELQSKLPPIYQTFSDRTQPRTVIVIPKVSIS